MLLDLHQLFFGYTDDFPLFSHFNLQTEEGKIIALAGESGCGKSTLLKLIYGLLQWNSGTIHFNGKNLLGPKANLVPGEPDMKFVAQDYDLMPYAKVKDNVGKFISNINLEFKKSKADELLEIVDLQDFANTLPKNLSGGQQQRVAIARALAVMPKLLLLDEPFSNLDASRKLKLRDKFFSYVKKENISLIISTHDVKEIMPWLDEIVILQNGRLIQKDCPEQVYNQPYNAYVAQLFGEVNLFSESEQRELELNRFFAYPHQIKISDSGYDATVLESRFAGSHFWNKIKLREKELIMYSDTPISGEIRIRFL